MPADLFSLLKGNVFPSPHASATALMSAGLRVYAVKCLGRSTSMSALNAVVAIPCRWNAGKTAIPAASIASLPKTPLIH